MKARFVGATAHIELEAVGGQVAVVMTKPDGAGGLRCLAELLTTEEAAGLIEALAAVACIAEEQGYQDAIDAAFRAIGRAPPPRDLDPFAADAAAAPDVPIPAYLKPDARYPSGERL